MDHLSSSTAQSKQHNAPHLLQQHSFVSKHVKYQQNPTPDSAPHSNKHRSREPHHLILRKSQKTNPIVWFVAILCMVFILLIIFFAVAILVIFLVIQPKNPAFNTPAASITSIYFDSPEFITADVTLLANFSNPNRKLDVTYEYLYLKLFFSECLIASQSLEPFHRKPGEARIMSVHMVEKLVHVPFDLAGLLQDQEQRNRVILDVKWKFRVKFKLGVLQHSRWLQGKCIMEMTSPPNSYMIYHSCRTS